LKRSRRLFSERKPRLQKKRWTHSSIRKLLRPKKKWKSLRKSIRAQLNT